MTVGPAANLGHEWHWGWKPLIKMVERKDGRILALMTVELPYHPSLPTCKLLCENKLFCGCHCYFSFYSIYSWTWSWLMHMPSLPVSRLAGSTVTQVILCSWAFSWSCFHSSPEIMKQMWLQKTRIIGMRAVSAVVPEELLVRCCGLVIGKGLECGSVQRTSHSQSLDRWGHACLIGLGREDTVAGS